MPEQGSSSPFCHSRRRVDHGNPVCPGFRSPGCHNIFQNAFPDPGCMQYTAAPGPFPYCAPCRQPPSVSHRISQIRWCYFHRMPYFRSTSFRSHPGTGRPADAPSESGLSILHDPSASVPIQRHLGYSDNTDARYHRCKSVRSDRCSSFSPV